MSVPRRRVGIRGADDAKLDCTAAQPARPALGRHRCCRRRGDNGTVERPACHRPRNPCGPRPTWRDRRPSSDPRQHDHDGRCRQRQERFRPDRDADGLGYWSCLQAARRSYVADFRGGRAGQGDRDRAGRVFPGMDVQWARARSDVAGHGGRPIADRVPEQWITSALDALPRHPFRPHGRRAGRRLGRSRCGVRLRVRRAAVRMPPLSLSCAAA